MDERFSEWLRADVPSEITWQTKLSEARRLERVYGDLDTLYDADEMEGMMGELAYSAVDKRNQEPNPSQIPIDGDIYNNLSSYRSAARKYQRFRECQHRGDGLSLGSEILAEAELSFRYEEDLQSALISCIGQIEKGMTLAANGKEYAVASGRIDALALDSESRHVVIELKAVTARREVLGQIAAYMADIEDATGTRPRGILIAPDFDAKLMSGARMIDGLRLMKYHFSFTFSKV